MEDQIFQRPNFEHPPILFRLEDLLKNFVGEKLLYRDFIQSFQLKGDEHVLDFGCGGGIGTRCLAKHLGPNGTVAGLDTSEFMLKKARRRLQRYPQAQCLQGDIRDLNLPRASIDVIMIVHVLHDIMPGDRQETLNAFAKILTPGGNLFIREPIRQSHGMPVAEIQRLFLNAGFGETQREIRPNKWYQGRYSLLL